MRKVSSKLERPSVTSPPKLKNKEQTMTQSAQLRQRLIFCGLLALLLSGCQSPTMKGTPFYTGEYDGPEEGYTDRVNLWPALYYRDPALSVLWPFFERTDDHTAVRPVFSIYNKKSDNPTYNVLWPIARFDTGKQSNRIFPAFWGKDSDISDEYFVIAPLYWHLDDPFAGDGVNALFPFWIWKTDSKGHRIDILWPLYANKKTDTERMWRVWPFYGYDAWNKGSDVSRFWAWPLGGSKKNARVQQHYLFPLYYAGNKGLQNDLWTLLGGQSTGPDGTRWAAFPALSWGEKTDSRTKNTYLMGLAGNTKTADKKASHIFPLYAKRDAKDSSYIFSLPYSAAKASDGSAWKASLPLFHSQTDADGANQLITPLYSRKNNSEGNNLWRCYFPLLYLDETYDNHFMTLLGGRWRTGNNSGWLATPILSGGTKTTDCEKTIWAAGLAGKKSTAEKTSHYALPIYYTCPQENRFISLPYLRWTNPDQTCYHAIPPLLSGTSTHGNTKKTMLAAGIAFWEKQGDQLNRSNILPLYCWKNEDYLYTLLYGKTKTSTYFATPLAGRYLNKKGGWVFPLWKHEATDKRKETNLLLGLANSYQTKTSSGNSLFPLYSKSQSQRKTGPEKSLTRHRKNFNALILLWNSQSRLTDAEDTPLEENSTAGLFPLWLKHLKMPRDGGKTIETSSLLFRLYDIRRETPRKSAEKTYTRHRVLWRMYHKETLGADSSTDIFPAITIDKKENGFRKVSFLWRLFRYENDPDTETTKLDLCFIPIKR